MTVKNKVSITTPPPPKKDLGEIASTVGKYLLAIAAILGGIQAVISRWPAPKPSLASQVSTNDFCPQFIQGVSDENSFIYLLGKSEDETPNMDQVMLVRFLNETDSLGYIKFYYSANNDIFTVRDVTDDKCLGIGKSNFDVKNGEAFEIELKEQKNYHLLLSFDPDKKVLHLELKE
jgi:hypothetical protein